jgi:hypothetical protein
VDTENSPLPPVSSRPEILAAQEGKLKRTPAKKRIEKILLFK